MDQKLDDSKTMKDPGIHVPYILTLKILIEEQMREANKVLYFLRRNIAVKVKTLVRLGLYKSPIMPVLLHKSRSLPIRHFPEEGSAMNNWE